MTDRSSICLEVVTVNLRAVTYTSVLKALRVSLGPTGAVNFARSIHYAMEQMVTLRMKVIA